MGKERSAQCLCTCKAHCQILSPMTGRYYGRWIPRSTRDAHVRDERNRRRQDQLERSQTLDPLAVTPLIRMVNQDESISRFRDEFLFLSNSPTTSLRNPLIFINNPLTNGEFVVPEFPEILEPNAGIYALRPDLRINQAFIMTENRCCNIFTLLRTIKHSKDSRDALMQALVDHLVFLNYQKSLQWAQFRGGQSRGGLTRTPNGEAKSPLIVNSEPYFYTSAMMPAVRAASVLSVVLQNFYFLPRRALRLQLSGIRDIIRHTSTNSSSLVLSDTQSIPKDPRTCSSHLQLDPIVTQFISCPTCHYLYPYEPDGSQSSAIPLLCSYRETKANGACGSELSKQKRIGGNDFRSIPIRKYLHQDIGAWLGRLLSRKGIEDHLDNRPHLPTSTTVDDILLSDILLSLKDSSGNPFLSGAGDECRLVFSLSVDSFDPFGNQTAKQSVSDTGIWLVLLNLPWHIRYRPENMYLAGIIPYKPPTHKINHYLQLVINDFLELWDPGIFFSRTYKFRLGRLVKAMLVLVICDMLAVRQVVGYANSPTAHYFCLLCDLDIHDIGVFDREEWPSKSLADARRFATLWRDAETQQERDSIFEAFGWRWSPLFDLPYFDPTLSTVVDSMHALDLGLFQNHCRSLFGIDLDHAGGNGSSSLPPASKKVTSTSTSIEIARIKACNKLVEENGVGLLYNLLAFQRRDLYTICLYYDIRIEGRRHIVGTRWVLAKQIYNWRQSLDNTAIMGNFPIRNAKSIGLNNETNDAASDKGDSQESESVAEINDSMRGDYDEIDEETDEEMDDGYNGHIERVSGRLDGEDEGAEEMMNISDSEGEESGGPDSQGDGNSVDLAHLIQEAKNRRILRHLTDVSTDRSIKQGRALAQATRPLYFAIARYLQITLPSHLKKLELHNTIVNLIAHDPLMREKLRSFVPADKTAVQSAVLGRDVMETVWNDMKKSLLPSWISPAPHNWGTKTRGKLSADNWRVVCTIHLPITLIWLWRGETERKKQLLENFMDLVTAIRIANMRVSSHSQADAYNKHIFRYVRALPALFPQHHLRPIHHAALHVGDGIRRFGPIHAHNASHYERHISFLHQINTNNKVGELEATLLRGAIRNANLLAVLSDDAEIRDSVLELMETLGAIQAEDIRGFRLATLLDPTTPEFPSNSKRKRGVQGILDNDQFTGLLDLYHDQADIQGLHHVDNEVLFFEEISHNGVCYGTHSSSHFRNSAILFYPHLTIRGAGEMKAGIIEAIFEHHSGLSEKHFLLVRQHNPINRSEFVDPYQRFGFAAGFLCEKTPTLTRIISLSQIVSHFVLTPMEEIDAIHVLPFDRLMLHFETNA